MSSHNDRLPPQPSVTSSGDDGDTRRLHPTLSNSATEEGRYRRLSGASSSSQQTSHNPDPSRYHQARQPINDAVTSAFNTADATSYGGFSPELLQQITSQITANVLQQLKTANLYPPPHQPPPVGSQMDTSSSAAGSPPLDRATVYTPPTPHRCSEDAGVSQASPQFPPPSSQSSSFRAPSPGVERRAVSPLSQTGHVSENEANQTRPRGPGRVATREDATILERVWGQLFTEQGEATPRLGQFLRGIATYLIEDYEPKHSLVITPTKMQRYYEDTRLANEFYPWNIIFDDRTSSISRMFREIECQHHLVQEKLNERPDTPGLTPQGFETWATLLLKAHPDQEYERLAKTALEMPISNPDEKKERFPKELSRRLFPKHGDTEIAYKLQKAMSTHCNVSFASRHSSMADSTSRTSTSTSTATVVAEDSSTKTNLKPPTDKPEHNSNNVQPSPVLSQASLERQRQPYGGTHSDGVNGDVTDEGDEGTTVSQPIERERKPYVAAPGGGKNYDNIDRPAALPEIRPGPPPQEPRLGRSSSLNAASRATDASRSGQQPISLHQRPPPPAMEIPESRHHRSNTTYHKDPPQSGRNRSPSMNKESGASSHTRRTDPDVSYMSSSHHSDHHDDTRRYREYEAGRERLANDRYDAARMSAYDPRERDRDRDGRPRMQSVSNAGLGFVDSPRSPTLRTTGGTSLYSSSLPTAGGEEEYYLNRMHTGGAPPSYNGHSPPSSISTGFQPPPPPPPPMIRESSSTSRDSGYPSYPINPGYPPTSYREVR
ncbi:uncharacterized protein Z519_04854 [Cladophialophora bantiana CBS 173.52]|uniref:DUF7514 domain-containing protein n=1 Tax=Cladophialophora bantiana (strain ATCC 10958 / CBS 173.52 / CDC B-1940 / NIH 8579) TaxID=1442370 RepID=A0A0D2EY23_CLAB1|nr:uncharacterized protein Z519_04854 [Cladophialophora bantiana CBS 173.52]KIW94876.1 hypothetical protein Z519_04854 [Cladophialophora bantiana CBS 173.52]